MKPKLLSNIFWAEAPGSDACVRLMAQGLTRALGFLPPFCLSHQCFIPFSAERTTPTLSDPWTLLKTAPPHLSNTREPRKFTTRLGQGSRLDFNASQAGQGGSYSCHSSERTPGITHYSKSAILPCCWSRPLKRRKQFVWRRGTKTTTEINQNQGKKIRDQKYYCSREQTAARARDKRLKDTIAARSRDKKIKVWTTCKLNGLWHGSVSFQAVGSSRARSPPEENTRAQKPTAGGKGRETQTPQPCSGRFPWRFPPRYSGSALPVWFPACRCSLTRSQQDGRFRNIRTAKYRN